jgi:hypothetical protein
MRHSSGRPFHSREHDGQNSGTSSMLAVAMAVGLS